MIDLGVLLRSGLFDAEWYQKTYDDVDGFPAGAIDHYLRYGANLGRDPSPFFNTTQYLADNLEAEASGANPLWHYLQFGRHQGARVTPSALPPLKPVSPELLRQTSVNLEHKLWGGFSGEVLPVLEAKVLSPQQPDTQRAIAAWALARWYAFHKDYSQALLYLYQQQTINPRTRQQKATILLEADCLNRLLRPFDARERLRVRPSALRNDIDLQLALANTFTSAEDDEAGEHRLALLNGVLAGAGFASLSLREQGAGLSLFNLSTESVAPVADSSVAKVSVLMPAFNAGADIELALNSLLAQSWTNLEIIVADDASTDDTRERVRALAARDARVVLLPLAENGGAYAARNAALKQASGDFITVHDSDDWSHPQRLAYQVEDLLEQPEAVANITDWVRSRPDLYFTGTFRAHGALVSENTSSLMVRRSAFDALGRWDLARTSADSELVRRLRAYYGDTAVRRLSRGVPLAFALDRDASLTRVGATHAKTLFYGPRREYRESADAWHAQAQGEGLRLPLEADAARRFPIPQLMQVRRPDEAAHYDVVVIADFNLGGGAYISTINYVEAALQAGKRVALFHWRRCDLDVTAPLRPELRRQALDGRFDVLTLGDRVQAGTVLVGYPVVLNYRLDAVPQIETKCFAILVNQMASRLTTGEDPQYDPRRIHANVKALFGIDPVWVPISGYVRELMLADTRYPVPYDEPWNPLLDVDSWCQRRVHWRGRERAQPVVGRHARDHYTKWPMQRVELEAAYCAGRDCEVRLLGGAQHALGILGYTPKNWTVGEYTDSTYDFLLDLDFFVHFPHEQYIEEFGRAVLEAMGLGIPAILPPVFKATFGDAAQYCEPDGVWPMIQVLWADEAAYNAASERALAFVQERAGYSVFEGRVASLRQVALHSEASDRPALHSAHNSDPNVGQVSEAPPAATEPDTELPTMNDPLVRQLTQKVTDLETELAEKNTALEARFEELAELTRQLEQKHPSKPPRFPVRPWHRRLLDKAQARLPKRSLTLVEQSPLFDAQWYLQAYPELAQDPIAASNPAKHYLTRGWQEGRNPGPDFDSQWYLNRYPDIRAIGMNPLLHYILHGMEEGRAPKR